MRSPYPRPCRAALSALLIFCGCSGDGDESGAGASDASDNSAGRNEVGEIGSRLEGIYELTFHELNLDACELGGSPVAGHTFLVLYSRSAPTLSVVDVFSCASVEECRTVEAAVLSGSPVSVNFHFRFDQRASEASIAGTSLENVREGEQCFRKLTDATLVETVPGELRIEAQIWHGDYYRPRSSDSCASEMGDVPTVKEPCTQLESLNATRVAELP